MKYNPVKLLHVSLLLDTESIRVGSLALKDQHIWFEYENEWLNRSLEISPFNLPLKPGVSRCDDRTFDGLLGVFNDSLPDGWGRLLLDRQVRHHSIAPESLTPLDRLAHVGTHGMGALMYEPDYAVINPIKSPLDLDQLADETNRVLEGETDTIVEELLALNGSSGGARPKILVGVDPKRKRIIHSVKQLASEYEYWLIKFPSQQDPKDIGAIEFAYNLMGSEAGLNVMPSYLFPAKNGAGYFGIQRFDRCQQNRIHIHTACGLLHADYRMPSLDYDDLLKATLALTKDFNELTKMFRIAVFNVLAHNRDDHSRNVAFMMESSGRWRVAPAYDLTFSYGFGGEHNMMVLGEGKNPTTAHLKKIANKFSITNADEIISQVRQAVNNWETYANQAGVSSISKKSIAKKLKEIL